MLWVLGGVVLVVLLLVFVVLTYNGLVRRRNQVDNAWGRWTCSSPGGTS